MPEGETTAQRGHVTGIGGVFVASPDPQALARWYRDALGLSVEPWGGAVFRGGPDAPPTTTWSAMPPGDDFAPSTRDVTVNFTVDDLDAIVRRVEAHGTRILKRDDSDPHGRFAWLIDPDGTKIELWEPER